jgi:predicted Zn finger-like uncharacterized protein
MLFFPMAFAVNCKSCQARFLLNDDLLRRKVAGKIVTVRCRQCHATIEVDASDMDPLLLPDSATPQPPPRGLGHTRAPRAAPAPPRPTAKSTLMGIGAPRAAAATELVALSPGLLNVKTAPVEPATAQGFPEPPPPPGAIEELDAGDWDELETPAVARADTKEEPAPESLDDFAEELPPSLPPEEEMPSSTGTPSLNALIHHDQHAPTARRDDFLVNMSAAMNGGIMAGAPTIDVSGLSGAPAAEQHAPSIDVTDLTPPARSAKTLPLFSPDDAEQTVRITAPSGSENHAASTSAEGSLGPSTLDRRSRSDGDKPVDSPRERRNVVAPTTESVPPAGEKKASGFAAPLLLALAAAAGFLIWKRSYTPPAPSARAEPAAERATATPPPPPIAPAQAEPIAATSAAPAEELTFESAPSPPSTPVGERPPSTKVAGPAGESKPAGAQEPAPQEELKPEPAAEAEPPAEPAGPFDRAAASAALNASAAQASSCRKDGDPSGVASVVITFAPSGRVTSANISGPPFAGTPTGGCIASTLRKAKIPAFDGERVTVSKTVVIQ